MSDVSLLPGTILKGRCVVGEGTQIGPHAMLTDTTVGVGALIETVSANGAHIGDAARVESFTILEPGSQVLPSEHVSAHSRRGL